MNAPSRFRARVSLVSMALMAGACSAPMNTPCTFGPAPPPSNVGSPPTPGKKWGAPQPIASSPFAVDNLKILLGPNDTMVALWTQSALVNATWMSQLVEATQDNLGQWSTATTVLQGENSIGPMDAAIDQEGRVIAAWVDVGSAGVSIKAVRFSSFSGKPDTMAPQQVGFLGGNRTGSLRVAATPAGDAMALWIGSPTDQLAIEVSRFSGATNLWSASPRQLNGASNAAVLALDANGNAAASWIQRESTGIDALHHQCFNAATQTWGGFAIYSLTNYGSASAPTTLFDSVGNLVVLWSQTFGNGVGIEAQRYFRPQAQWEPPLRIDPSPPSGGALYSRLAASPSNGLGYGLWFYTPGNTNLNGRVVGTPYNAGAGYPWGQDVRLDQTVDPANPSLGGLVWSLQGLAVAPDFEAFASWVQTDNGLYVVTKPQNGLWGNPMRVTSLSASPPLAAATVLLTDTAARATLVWIDNNKIWASRYQ